MKINQRYVILLGIVVFLVAFVLLYMSYARQKNENTLAKQNLSTATTAYNNAVKEKANQEGLLTQANTQITDLQNQLSQAQLQLQNKQQVIPESIENIDYNELLFNIANNNKLTVVSISVAGPTENQVNEIPLYTTSFAISVKGYTQDILNYINDITKDINFVSATVDGVTMTASSEQAEDGTTVTTTQGDISISLYGYGE